MCLVDAADAVLVDRGAEASRAHGEVPRRGPAGSFNPGPSWHVVGAGQFGNGDIKSDILWQADFGQAAVWLMDGTSMVGGGPVGGNPGADWHLIA